MKTQFVNALQDGDTLNDYFVAVRKDLREKKDGGKFLGMVLKDKTGEIGGVMWRNAVETANQFELGDVVNVRGKVATYQQRLQVQLDQVLALRENEYTLDDLVNQPFDASKDLAGLRDILGTIENPFLKQLVDAFFADADFVEQFARASAAKKWHHEFAGGLVRHCYEMARIAETMCELYPDVSRDLLLTGVFIHDIGKLTEMSHGLYSDYTDAGRLLGHLQIGCDMVTEKIQTIPDFPEHLRLELLHFVLSHHGEEQFGSPVKPKTLEAIVLHLIDNLDAQAAAVSRIARETREQGKAWSDYQSLIERVIWARQA
ncbi:MAG: HD domain-containing protein [Candidatus Hydrogenedens sp.]|nr:HD domain-containing protein [Candidatus Hydrogenedens sp.]